MTKKVLVLWADRQSTNLGVQALAEGTSRLAVEAYPGCEVTFQSYGMIPATEKSLGLRSIAMATMRLDREFLSWLSAYDVVIDTGAGDSFSDIYGLRRLIEMSLLRKMVARSKGQLVMGPQTIGPFNSTVGRLIAQNSLKATALVVARDPDSYDVAGKLTRAKTMLGSDVAFLLPQESASIKADVLFNVSGLLWQPNDHVDHMVYREYAKDFVRKACDQGIKITLLNHVLDSDDSDNDSPATQALASDLPGRDLEIVTPSSLEDARSIIAGADVVVASRMHAALNALSQGVPAISWAYSRKFAPLLESLGWGYTLDLRDHRSDLVNATLAHIEVFRLHVLRADTVAHRARMAGNQVVTALKEL